MLLSFRDSECLDRLFLLVLFVYFSFFCSASLLFQLRIQQSLLKREEQERLVNKDVRWPRISAFIHPTFKGKFPVSCGPEYLLLKYSIVISGTHKLNK